MANSVIVKLQLQDELSPELKKAQAELEALAKETLSLDANLKELKANKKGIIKGAVESDIAEVKKLQKEISALRKQSTEKGAKKTDIKNKILERELKITALINAEIKKQTLLIDKNKNAEAKKSAQATQTLQKELRSRKKVTESIKSETTAIKKSSTSRLKENAERRALGTTIVRQIRRLESLAVAYYATTSAYNSTYGAGIKLNRQYQDLTLGLTALTSAGVDVSRNGTLLTGAEKFQALMGVTKDTLKQIKEAATETPATFNEMAEFYQQAIGHAIKSNGAMGTSLAEVSKNTIDLTKRMSNLGAAAGMDMYKVNEEIRSIMSGNASTDSLLAMMIFGSPSEANKAITEAKKSVNGLRDLFNKVLAPFDALAGVDSYTKNMAKLTNEIETIQKAASKQIFKDFNNSIVDMTKYLKNNGDDIVKSFQDIYSTIKAVVPVVYDLGKAFLAYKAVIISASAIKSSANFIRIASAINRATSSTRKLKIINELLRDGIIKNTAAFVAENLVIDATTKKVKILKSAQLLLNKAILKNPYIAATTLIAADLDIIYNGYKKIMEIGKKGAIEAKKNADAMDWSGKGFTFSMQAEAMADATEKAYDKMESFKKARDKSINANQRKAYDISYNIEKKNYEKSLKELNKFLNAKEVTVLTKEEALKKALEVKLKKAKDKADSAKKLKEQLKEQEQAYNEYFSVVGTKEEQFYKKLGDKLIAISSLGTDKQIKYYNKVMDEHRKQELKKEQEQAQNSLEQYRKALELIADPIDTINEKYLSMYDVIKNTFDETQLQKFYKKWQNEIDATNKKAKEYEWIGSRDWASGLNGQAKDIANVSNALRDIGTEQKKWQKFQQESIATDKDKQVHLEAQMGAYSMLAGTIASASKEGSAAAIAATAAQSALGIASSWTAIAEAWALGFPANLGAVAMVTAQVMPIIQQLGGSSGGGSASSPDYANVVDNYSTNLDDMNKPIIDRLDKQISLLQTISQRGTAGRVGVLKSDKEFALEMKQDAVDAIKTYFTNPYSGNVDNIHYSDSTTQKMFQDSGINIPTYNGAYNAEYYKLQEVLDASTKDVYTTANTLKILYDRSKKVFEDYKPTGYFDFNFGNISKNNYENAKKNIEQLQQTIYGFANDLSGSINDILDAGKDFKDLFDSITLSTTYATKELAKAQDKVNSLKGKDSLTDYLKKQITEVDYLQSKYGTNIQQLLLSNNPEDVVKQVQVLKDLEDATNQTFNNGVEDALNYLDSINLVGEAMANSNKNIKSWEDSFKTQEQLASEMISKFSYKTNEGLAWRTVTEDGHTFKRFSYMVKHQEKLATSYEELDAIYQRMANDVDGLTDAEIKALNANKALIDERADEKKSLQQRLDLLKLSGDAEGTLAYNRKLELASVDATNKILLKSIYAEQDRQKALNANKALLDAKKQVFDNTLDGWMTSLQTASEKALETSKSLIGISKSKTLNDYYTSMAETKSLLKAGNYDKFVKSLNNTVGLTSVLKDTSNFVSESDMLFNQLVASRQFEDISTQTQSQYDILKQIAETNSDLYKTQQEQNQLIEEQANEILKMRKEIQDQTSILDEIAEAS